MSSTATAKPPRASRRRPLEVVIVGAGFGGSILALLERTRTVAFEKAIGRPVLFCSTADGAYAAPGARRAHLST